MTTATITSKTTTPTLDEIGRNNDWNATVWVGNWGRYNEGELMGAWITLPVSEDDLAAFLREQVGIDGERYEEYGIFDRFTDGLPEALGIDVNEYDSVETLNTMCAALKHVERTTPDAADRVRIAVEMNGCENDPDQILNLIWQAEDIPYTPYEHNDDPTMSDNEKLAYTLIENGCLPEVAQLIETRWGFYLDIEKLGRDLAMDCYTSENGFVNASDELPDTSMYTVDEIRQQLAEEH